MDNNSTTDEGQWYDDVVSATEPAVPCILLIDTSESMRIDNRIGNVRRGIESLRNAILMNAEAADRVEFLVITFSNFTKVHGRFQDPQGFVPPMFEASGGTMMGAAINTALDELDNQKELYKKDQRTYYTPWLFLITDGIPGNAKGPDPEFDKAANRLMQLSDSNKILFQAIMVNPNCSVDHLKKLSSQQPISLGNISWKDLFVFISASVQSMDSYADHRNTRNSVKVFDESVLYED
jgi:uncharacterized protein YegL